MYRDHVYLPSLLDEVMGAAETTDLTQDGMTVGMSGFAHASEVKAVSQVLAMRAKERPLRISLMTGTSLGSNLDKQLIEAGVLARRMPSQTDSTLRKVINVGEAMFVDQHLSETVGQLRNHQLELSGIIVIEAATIAEQGHIVLTISAGNSTSFTIFAKQVIVEINLAHSTNLGGLHDIYIPTYRSTRMPIPLARVDGCIGSTATPIPPEKIIIIVISNQPDSPSTVLPSDDETQTIANRLVDFFKREVDAGRMSNSLSPLQAGIDSIANAVMYGLIELPFEDLAMYSEVLQDSTFDLIDAGRLRFASGSSITLSPQHSVDVFGNLEHYKDKLVLRPQEISSHPEVVHRLDIIGTNTALEFDICDNVNSTHVGGIKMMNGIGGSDNFAHGAHLVISVVRSIAKGDNISSVVLMVSHVDHTEHDVDILVIEQGLADLRGLAPRERAQVITEDYAHPSYQTPLPDYSETARAEDGHAPHLLHEALTWHLNLGEHGHMPAGRD